ncbi:MAG: N-acetylmuramoyl-L-alanine amidase [Pseudomonadota bacterium]
MPVDGTPHHSAAPADVAAPVWHPSQNFGPRRNAAQPELIVIHYTAMATAEAALDRLCDPTAEVSAHYLIGRDGALWQLVQDRDRAWHAGLGSWQGLEDVNSRSIGIELDNDGRMPFPEPQMKRLEELIATLIATWRIPPVNVIGHSDMAPGRKSDPGRRFDWSRLAAQGLAFEPGFAAYPELEAPGGNEQSFMDALADFGYPKDVDLDVLLDAFRARFRPFANGPLRQADHHFALVIANDAALDRTRSTA